MDTHNLQTDITILRERKLRRIEALVLCDRFIGRCTDEAAYGDSFSLFGRMRAIADLIEPAFEVLDRQQTVKVQDRRLQPYLRSQLFIALVAELEDFLGSLLHLVIRHYPKKISERTIKIDRLVDLGLSSAIEEAIDRAVHELFFAKPQQYRDAVLNFLSADSQLIADFWPAYVEMKARRDIGIHNDWKRNPLYDQKISEVGLSAPLENFLGVGDEYFENAVLVAKSMVETLCDHCSLKFFSA